MADTDQDTFESPPIKRSRAKTYWGFLAFPIGVAFFLGLWSLIAVVGNYPAFILPRPASVFGELKSHCHLDYIPVRRLHGNQTYLLAGLFAYNLMRELQMQTTRPARHTTAKRASLWVFERVDTIRQTLIQRAGRFTRPQNSLTLTISANQWLQKRFVRTLNSITGIAIA